MGLTSLASTVTTAAADGNPRSMSKQLLARVVRWRRWPKWSRHTT